MKNKFVKELLQWLEAIVIAIVVAILIRGFLFEPVIIDGSSMQNTLQNGDRVVLSKISLLFNKPTYGDVVVVEIEPKQFKTFKFLNDIELAKRLLPSRTGADYIKRVIALEGDTVDIRDGFVYVNGKKLDEPYIKNQGTTFKLRVPMPYTVEKGKAFVMGDNRQASKDSRSIGTVEISKIKGITDFRIWPLNSFGTFKGN